MSLRVASICHSPEHAVLWYTIVTQEQWFWGLTHGLSYYNCLYSTGQRTVGSGLQTAKTVQSTSTFGSWANDHWVIHGLAYQL